MTVGTARKYNPGFLTDDELVASFCIRMNEFESMVEMLRDCTGCSNPHQIVIGPRGSGKTSLLLRVAAEVRRDAELTHDFFPIVFAEESYEVATAGEFWLECLARLADQAPQREDAPDLHRTLEDLRTVRDDQTLGERCLAALLDFSDREGKRLVLLVENLNMLFDDIADRDVGWQLRQPLQTEPRIVLLASATSRFDEIDQPDHALYDLFRTLTLRPLDTEECSVLWESVSGQSRPPGTIRSLEILTGGSPRLLAIVARFGAGLSFRELMDNLLDLVDDHTEYFKSHLESLPPQERRVYLALADLWKPALTKEIADRARLSTSQCSAQLKRLIERGAVLVAGGSARRKLYYLAERLYNIYYLLRRNRGPNRLIEALIQFMAAYYSPDELRDIGNRFAQEMQSSVPKMRSLHELAYVRLMELAASAEHGTEAERLVHPDEDERVTAASVLFQRGVALGKGGRTEEELAAYDEVVRRFGKSEEPALLEAVAKALFNRGVGLGELDRTEEALAAYDEVLCRLGESDAPALLEAVAKALVNKGVGLGELGRTEDELAAYDEVLHRFGESEALALLEQVAMALFNKGVRLGALDRTEEALAAYDEVLCRFGESEAPALLEPVAIALFNKGVRLGALDRTEEALAAYDEVLRRFGESDAPALLEEVAKALVNKGVTLGALDRTEEALAACDEVLRRFGESEEPELLEQVAKALVNKGAMLGALDRTEEALAACDEILRRFGESDAPALLEQVAMALFNKGVTLGALDRTEEALAACDEVLRRFGESEEPELLEQVAKALVNKGAMLGALDRTEEALAACDEVLRRFGESEEPELLEQVAKALVSKCVTLSMLDRPEEALAASEEALHQLGESDVLGRSEQVSKALTDSLMRISVALGSERVRDLIQASPAADHFLPLTTALEQEMGLTPRVAREVEEVAEDIRRRLATLRQQ